jgi:broad-specificity NMP kinase
MQDVTRELELIICLSGHVGTGKTAVAHVLSRRLAPAVVCATREVLQSGGENGVLPATRAELQARGSQLDQDTGGAWVRDALPDASYLAPGTVAIVDAVRTNGQVAALASATQKLFHVHLVASRSVLEQRYARRRELHPLAEYNSYAELLQDPTESVVDEMATEAHLVVSTDSASPQAVVDRVRDALTHL